MELDKSVAVSMNFKNILIFFNGNSIDFDTSKAQFIFETRR